MTQPFAPIAAPAVGRPTVNLLAAANTPQGETVRWQSGSVYESGACTAVNTRDTCDPSLVTQVKSGVGPDDPSGRLVHATAVYAEAMYECIALPGLIDTYRQRALDALDAELPRAVEHELWTGAQARLGGYDNSRWLIDPDRVAVLNSGTAVKPSAALGLLEDALGDVYSGVGIVHCNRHAQVYLPTLTRNGRIIETRVGNRVVPGVGYPGTGPDALAAPAPAAATATTGGTLTADTYEYVVTATNAEGESVPSAVVARVVPAGTTTNTVTLTWAAVTGATGYRVYGRQSGALGLLGTPTAATYTDTGAGTPGAAPPTDDTSARPPAGTEWVYITPMVTVRVGDPETIDRAHVDPGVNRAQIIARAPFEVSWDACTGAFAILMQTVVEATP